MNYGRQKTSTHIKHGCMDDYRVCIIRRNAGFDEIAGLLVASIFGRDAKVRLRHVALRL